MNTRDSKECLCVTQTVNMKDFFLKGINNRCFLFIFRNAELNHSLCGGAAANLQSQNLD